MHVRGPRSWFALVLGALLVLVWSLVMAAWLFLHSGWQATSTHHHGLCADEGGGGAVAAQEHVTAVTGVAASSGKAAPIRVLVQKRITDPTWAVQWQSGLDRYRAFGFQISYLSDFDDATVLATVKRVRPHLFLITDSTLRLSPLVMARLQCRYSLTPHAAAAVTHDKRKLAEWMRSNGMAANVPPMMPFDAYLKADPSTDALRRRIGLPLLVKRSVGQGSDGVFVVRSRKGALAAKQRLKPVKPSEADVQALMPGTKTTMHFFAQDGRLLEFICYMTLTWFKAGFDVHERSRHDAQPLKKLIKMRQTAVKCNEVPGLVIQFSRLVEGLQYSGFGCVQSVMDSQGHHRVHDFNPRICFSAVSGSSAFHSQYVSLLKRVRERYPLDDEEEDEEGEDERNKNGTAAARAQTPQAHRRPRRCPPTATNATAAVL